MRNLVPALIALAACHSAPPEELLDNEVTDADLFEEPGEGEVFDLDTSADPELLFTGFGMMGNEQYGTWTEYDARAVQRGDGLDTLEVSVAVVMDSVETGNNQMESHLRTDDFFDVANYPTARFDSTALRDNEDGTWQVTGDLTLRATTREVSFPSSVVRDGDALYAAARIEFSRWDFGLYDASVDQAGGDGVGDRVFLDYDVVLVRR